MLRHKHPRNTTTGSANAYTDTTPSPHIYRPGELKEQADVVENSIAGLVAVDALHLHRGLENLQR